MSIALIGFGEVGQVLADDLIANGHPVQAFDIAFTDPASAQHRAALTRGLAPHPQIGPALAGARIVFCAVTAAADLDAAAAAADVILPGTFYVDLNSASPGVKQQAAQSLGSAGARYVEAAVMSPIEPARLASPMLLGGPHAAGFADLAGPLGFSSLTVFSDRIGPASATKMCRSVIIKGMEALLTEAMLAARHHGVEQQVLASLGNLLPGADWPALARYMISRSIEHGVRRAEEMREVAVTVAEAGVQPWMSEACVERQQWAPACRDAMVHTDLPLFIDAMREQLGRAG